MSQEPEQSRESRPSSLGEQLREARISAGRSLEDIAVETHIDLPHLQALEDNRFDEMSGPTFVKGYIRAFTRSLGVESEPYIKAYLKLGISGNRWHTHEPAIKDEPPGFVPGWGTLLLVVLGLLALFLVWYLGNDGSNPLGDAPQNASEQVSESSELMESQEEPRAADGESETVSALMPEPVPELSVAPSEGDESPAEEYATRPDDPAGEQQPSGSAAEIPATKPEEPGEAASGDEDEGAEPARNPPETVRAQSGEDRIELTVEGDSWIEVSGKDRKRLLIGLFKAGESRIVVGEAPFKVLLGNASSAQVRFNGKDIDTVPFSRGNVARFTLPIP